MQAESDRAALMAALNRAIREASALGQMFSEAIAEKVGLGGADLEYLDIVAMGGRMTAGELAAATGLTTGAVTGLVDRLERAGFVRRERDSDDRRRVFVSIVPGALGGVAPHYGSLATAMAGLADRYTDAELAMLVDFFAQSIAIMKTELRKAKAKPSDEPGTAAGAA